MSQLFEGILRKWKRRQGNIYVKQALKTRQQLIDEFIESVHSIDVRIITFTVHKTDHSFVTANFTNTNN